MTVTGAIYILQERGEGYTFGQTRRLLSDDELMALKRIKSIKINLIFFPLKVLKGE